VASYEHTPAEVIFDETLALQRANNRPDLAAEMMQLLIDSLPGDQASMNSAYTNKDESGFRRQIHKIHGATHYCGVPRLQAAIKTLETVTKQEQSLKSDTIRLALSITNDEIQALCGWYKSVGEPF
jgi:two-component system sensor histidine kinase BarA